MYHFCCAGILCIRLYFGFHFSLFGFLSGLLTVAACPETVTLFTSVQILNISDVFVCCFDDFKCLCSVFDESVCPTRLQKPGSVTEN